MFGFEKIPGLEKAVSKTSAEIVGIRAKVSVLNDNVETVTKNIEEQSGFISTLTERIADLYSTVSVQAERINALEAEVAELKKKRTRTKKEGLADSTLSTRGKVDDSSAVKKAKELLESRADT